MSMINVVSTVECAMPPVPLADLQVRECWLPHRDKRPYSANTGIGLAWNHPNAWSSYEKARSAGGENVGIVVGNSIVCIDLDKCLYADPSGGKSTTRVKPAFKALYDLALAQAAYVEISQSGYGIHIFLLSEWTGTVKASFLKVGTQSNESTADDALLGGGIEIYGGRADNGNATRYIAITGNTKRTGKIKAISACNVVLQAAVALAETAKSLGAAVKNDSLAGVLATPSSDVRSDRPVVATQVSAIPEPERAVVKADNYDPSPISVLNNIALRTPELWFPFVVSSVKRTNADRWQGIAPGTGSTNVSLDREKGMRWWSAESNGRDSEGMSPLDAIAEWFDEERKLDPTEAAAALMQLLGLTPAMLRSWTTLITRGTRDGPQDVFASIPEVARAWVTGTLPDVIEHYAECVSIETGNDGGSAKFVALSVFMAAIPSNVRCKPRSKGDWEMPASTYSAIVTRSGGGKGPIMRPFIAPLLEMDAVWAREHEARIRNTEDEEERKRLRKVGPRKRVTDSPTTEALTERMSMQRDGVILRAEELSGQIGMIGRSGNGRANANPDSRIYLEMYDGGGLDIPRKTAGLSVSFTRSCLSIIGGIQTRVLGGMIEDLSEDGLLQRFMFARMTTTELGETCEDVDGKALFRDVVHKLMRLGGFGEDIILTCTTEAETLLMLQANKARKLMATLDVDALKSVLGKAHAFIARVAFTLTLVDWAIADRATQVVLEDEENLSIPKVIELEHMERAAAWWWGQQWPNILDVYSDMGFASEQADDCKAAARYMLEHPTIFSDRFTARDFRALRRFRPDKFNGDHKRQRLFDALARLEDAGWLKAVGGDGKLPTYEADPRVWQLFGHQSEPDRMAS